MSCKKQICYEHVFAYIHEHIFDLECASFTTDYEMAMRNAILKQYPDAIHRCCWFHYTQAVKRNASKIAGFVPMVRGNMDERELYYKIMCLPLLPSSMIRASFDMLNEKGRSLGNDAFNKFLDYVERQWMERVCAINSFHFVFLYFIFFICFFLCNRRGRKTYLFLIRAYEQQAHSSRIIINYG